MPISPEIMRALLLIFMTAMAVLAGFFLSGRKLPREDYLGWGLLIVLLPFLGPFLVILFHPGTPIIKK